MAGQGERDGGLSSAARNHVANDDDRNAGLACTPETQCIGQPMQAQQGTVQQGQGEEGAGQRAAVAPGRAKPPGCGGGAIPGHGGLALSARRWPRSAWQR